MYDTQEIRLSQREEYKSTIVTCPKCGSYLVKGIGHYSYVCLDCLNEFSDSPMADDDSIPFRKE